MKRGFSPSTAHSTAGLENYSAAYMYQLSWKRMDGLESIRKNHREWFLESRTWLSDWTTTTKGTGLSPKELPVFAWLDVREGVGTPVCLPFPLLGIVMPVMFIPCLFTIVGRLWGEQMTYLFNSQVFRLREMILKELDIKKYTWGASCEAGSDLDVMLLNFELMLQWDENVRSHGMGWVYYMCEGRRESLGPRWQMVKVVSSWFSYPYRASSHKVPGFISEGSQPPYNE